MENKEIKDIMENRENNLQATCPVLFPENERADLKDIERSLIKRYRKNVWSKFVKAIKEYNLIEDGDKIAVAISGGKDSLIMAKLFQELKKNGKDNFELEFIAMDPGYHPSIKELLLENAKYLEIPLTYYPADIFAVADKIAGDYPCYMCARMRRGSLYAKAKELGCNKLALGHHFNDVIETTMINMLYAGTVKTMTPKVKSTSGKLELIRPLIYVREADIIEYTKKNGIRAMNCGCTIEAGKTSSKRKEVKDLLAALEEKDPGIKQSIFNSMKNINLDYVFGYTHGNKKDNQIEDDEN